MTRAQRLWLDVEKGRSSEKEAFDCLIRSVDEKDFARQIASAPEAMLAPLIDHLARERTGLAGEDWFSHVFRSAMMVEAFGGDPEKERAWRQPRVEALYALCLERDNRPREKNA